MRMPSKLQFYAQLADQTAVEAAGSYQKWTALLRTMARVYKYPYHEQLMIFAQRPEATACADYEIWNKQMHRYVKRGSTGIALIDTSGDNPSLKYVFDVSDTGGRENSRRPYLFQYRQEHEQAVITALTDKFARQEAGPLLDLLEDISIQLAGDYWQEHRQDILDNIDGSFLEDYDEYNLQHTFLNAAAVSTTYTVMARCGLDPDERFEHLDFMPVFDFNTPQVIAALGSAVSQSSEAVLRQIEITVKKYERAKTPERSQDYERTDIQPERRLQDSQPEPVPAGEATPGQVREDAQEVPSRASSGAVEQPDPIREAVSPSAGDRPDGEQPVGADDARTDEIGGGDGGTESQRPDEMDGADEHSESPGGGDHSDGAGVQLTEGPPASGEQFSFFPSESSQITYIEEAERAEMAPSAFSMPQEYIDQMLRVGSNTENHRSLVAIEYAKQQPLDHLVGFLEKTYHGGYGLQFGDTKVSAWYAKDGMHIAYGNTARYARNAQIVSWEDISARIGELLEEGQFATNVELAEMRGFERRKLAETLWYMERDVSQEAKEQGHMSIVHNLRGGFPEDTEKLMVYLSEPESYEAIMQELYALRDAYHENPKVMRFRLYNPDRVIPIMEEYTLPRLEYRTAMAEDPEEHPFITEDEIEDALSGGSIVEGSKGRIYDFYQTAHTQKEKLDFLKDEYGTGGGNCALSRNFRSERWFDSKGIRYDKPGCVRIELSWNKVLKYMDGLMESGRFYTPEELAKKQAQDTELVRSANSEPAELQEKSEEAPQPTIRELYDKYKPTVVAAITEDTAYRNACGHTDRETAVTAGNAAIRRAVLDSGDTELIHLYTSVPTFRNRLHKEAIEETYPKLHELLRPLSQDDIDDAIRAWNGSPDSKRAVVRYMENHGRERNTAAWLSREYGGDEGNHLLISRADSPEETKLSWPQVQRRIAQLIKEDRFLEDWEKVSEPRDYSAEYQLLDRLRSDCEYFLGEGQRSEKHLWAGNIRGQIAKMRELYDMLPDKPEWLSQEAINDYEDRMAPPYLVVAYHHFENGFDEKLDYQTLEEAEKAAQGYVDGIMESDGFQYDGAAIFDQQERKYVRIYGDYPDEKAHAQVGPPVQEPTIPAESVSPVAERNPLAPRYKVGDTVYLDDTLFEITEVGNHNIQLRDPALAYPIFRSESKESFERMLLSDERNAHLFTPERKSPAQNFRITDDALGAGGAKAKYQANINAIKLLKSLESEGMQASPEQQEILSRYVGWGGIPDAFDPNKPNWAAEYQELKGLLTPAEYDAARASTLNAHYTSPTVIRAIYEAVGNMGFQTGNILEPAMGVGNFFGMLPEEMRNSRLYGVELDSISGRIAQQLYPKANITVAGFETTDRRDFFDLAVGNVPFGQEKVNDLAYNKLGFSLHNYFFAKALDQVRPGGVVAFVTSRYTMDAKSPEVRKYLAQRADLLGAIRLPNNAFKANAGTEVVSDIIFLQKRDRPIDIEPDWVHLGENKDGYAINRYFLDNPHMVLGHEASESSRFGMDYTVLPCPDLTLAEQLQKTVKHIHGTYVEAELPDLGEGETIDDSIPADPDVKNFSYTLVDGEVYFRENSRMVKPKLNATAKERVKGMIGLRECVRQLIDLQMDPYTDDDAIHKKQAELNALYDAFSEKHGLINDRGNRLAFSDDSSYYLLCSLEVLDEDNNLARKADMFTKRTIRQAHAVTSVETASEALAISIAERARVDMPFMASLSGKSEEELVSELRGVVFRLPEPADGNGNLRYVTADEYLSGNVRQKLAQAKEAMEYNPDIFRDNVAALEAAQPEDLEASEIDVRLGATWIDKQYIQQFMEDLLNPPYYLRRSIQVNFSPYTADWNISGKSNISYNDVNAYTTYGTSRINAYHILEDTLNLRDVRVYDTVQDTDGKERRVLNQKETTLAQQKQQAIRDAFQDWIWQDPYRRNTLVTTYNELFNSTRPREYDGSHITFGGMSPEITLREHQRNAIAHILYGGNTLLAHEVGSGKTFEMVAAAMESKRLGLCSKSLIAVPNHLTEQWAAEFLRLYPSANILVARKKDFEPARRKMFCAKIATGDYDAVIMGHSQLEKIPISMERQQQLIEDQIAEIQQGIDELRFNRGERFSIKALERTKKSLETKLQKLTSTARKDDVVTFEQLGVDRMFVDEAHGYKNLFLYSKMRNVAGLSTSDAQKSSDMYLKCRYLDEVTGGRGVVFATGTPVSNSMTELYTMMRYLQHDTLKKQGWSHFDCWAAQFGETKTVIELAPEGTGYRARTRFAKFFNLPELITIWKEAADVKTADQLNLPRPKAVYHNEVAQPTPQQQELVQQLSERAADVHSGKVDPSIDNMLRITSDGRKLGLDQRIINPDLPDDPGSKVNMCVRNLLRIWKDGQADKLTQLVFCDISTPKARAGATKAIAKTPAENLDSQNIPALEGMAELPEEASFTVYEDIRSKLIASGVPAEEIAFIHDANTDARKKELFGKVRAGQVRILMGSTFKMGAGMNVQDRLIALHDLDCPWRPGDLEQRSGRIIRQGNQNPEVHIYRYVTEGTFDSYLWQTVENKQKFISQIMTSKSPMRSCEDVDETALSYAEIKALCAGDPRIKEKMDLDIEVSRLKLLRSDHKAQQYNLEDKLIRVYPEQVEKIKGIISNLKSDIALVEAHPHPAEGFVGMEVKGDNLTDKDNAGTALLEALKDGTGLEPVPIGTYRGFQMFVTLEDFGKKHILTMKGSASHRVELGRDPKGNLVRIENVLSDIPQRLKAAEDHLQNIHTQIDTAKAELGKPFLHEAEYQQKSERLAELNAILDIDGKKAAVISEEEPTVEKRSRPSVLKKLKAPVANVATGRTPRKEYDTR